MISCYKGTRFAQIIKYCAEAVFMMGQLHFTRLSAEVHSHLHGLSSATQVVLCKNLAYFT